MVVVNKVDVVLEVNVLNIIIREGKIINIRNVVE